MSVPEGRTWNGRKVVVSWNALFWMLFFSSLWRNLRPTREGLLLLLVIAGFVLVVSNGFLLVLRVLMRWRLGRHH